VCAELSIFFACVNAHISLWNWFCTELSCIVSTVENAHINL
jgi:hypothetical protein